MPAEQNQSFDPDALDLNPKALEGLTVVITGTLPNLSRMQAQELVERAGGKVTGSISSKTNLLIAGDKAGSKLKKAEELGIGVKKEHDFLESIRTQSQQGNHRTDEQILNLYNHCCEIDPGDCLDGTEDYFVNDVLGGIDNYDEEKFVYNFNGNSYETFYDLIIGEKKLQEFLPILIESFCEYMLEDYEEYLK